MDNVINIKEEDLKCIVEVAFERGMNWSDTYKGWFTPTDEQTENEINNAYENIITTLSILENMRTK